MQKTAIEKNALSAWRMRLYMLIKLPLAFVAGLKVEQLDSSGASVSVPFCFLTKNPFRSIYFAPLSMAAELASGLLALDAAQQSEKPVSMLVQSMQAEYLKKARSRTTFRCNDRQAIKQAIAESLKNADGTKFTSLSEGKDAGGEIVARFQIVWTFKQK